MHSTKIRTRQCNLPSIRPFPPHTYSSSRVVHTKTDDDCDSSNANGEEDEDEDAVVAAVLLLDEGGTIGDDGKDDEGVSKDSRVSNHRYSHKKQQCEAIARSWCSEEEQKENAMMEMACDQIQWFMDRLIVFLKDTNGGGGGDGNYDDAVEGSLERRTFCNLFEKPIANARRYKYHASWTIFDMQQLSKKLKDSSSSIKNDVILPMFVSFLQDGASSDSNNEHDRRMHQSWYDMLHETTPKEGFNNNNLDYGSSWEDVLLLPLRNAAFQILFSIYHRNTITTTNESSSSSSSSSVVDRRHPKKSIHNYLCYHASRTLEHLQHFVLRHLSHQYSQQQQNHYRTQQRSQEQLTKLNNDIFEEWDEYCANVLGVESDTLPLFPELKGEKKEVVKDDDDTAIMIIIDKYAKEVGNRVVGSMRNELERRSEQFLQLLLNNVNDDGDDDDGVRSGGGGGNAKWYGRDIYNAIAYYRQFTQFLSMASSGGVDDVVPHCDTLSTLYRYVAPFTNNESTTTTTSSSLLSQFTTSPATRANLVSDLQQLEAFLSTRKLEMLSSRSSSYMVLHGGGGRDVTDAMELEWKKYCMTHPNNPASSSSSTPSLEEEVTFDDVTRFINAVQCVTMQIVGNGVPAKRLRFLADVVGLPTTTTNSNNNDILRDEDEMFLSTCRKAAWLARRMALYQDRGEASCNVVELCGLMVGRKKVEMEDVECRIEWIREGLIESGCSVGET